MKQSNCIGCFLKAAVKCQCISWLEYSSSSLAAILPAEGRSTAWQKRIFRRQESGEAKVSHWPRKKNHDILRKPRSIIALSFNQRFVFHNISLRLLKCREARNVHASFLNQCSRYLSSINKNFNQYFAPKITVYKSSLSNERCLDNKKARNVKEYKASFQALPISNLSPTS